MAVETSAAVITEAGLSGRSRLCVETLELFISIYGAEAGNLALKAMATGGVFLAGGIAPRMIPKLSEGVFMKAFVDKGRYAALLRCIPVRIILNETVGLLGAARYGLDHLTAKQRTGTRRKAQGPA
jgi:glucokinase